MSKTTKKPTKLELYEKQIFDLKQLLEISKSLCSVLDYSTLIESVLYVCLCQMHVLSAGIMVAKDVDSVKFELQNFHTGLNVLPNEEYSIPINHPIVDYFGFNPYPLTLLEIKRRFGELGDLDSIKSLNPSLIVPLQQKNHLVGILLLGEKLDLGNNDTKYSKYDREQISSIASLAAIAINNAALLEMSTTDRMTHLKMKHYFYTVLTEKIDNSFRTNTPISVLMFDIDHFKNFNDTYGHACGDYVLTEVARIISDGIRDEDLASRYGGEEFCVLLPDSGPSGAMLVAERIRKNIEKNQFSYDGQTMNVTISIGVSVLNPPTKMTPKQLVDLADKGLYLSKERGRNCSTFAPHQ